MVVINIVISTGKITTTIIIIIIIIIIIVVVVVVIIIITRVMLSSSIIIPSSLSFCGGVHFMAVVIVIAIASINAMEFSSFKHSELLRIL